LQALTTTGISVGPNVGREGPFVPLHQAVKSGLLGAVMLAMKRGAIRRPMGLPGNGVHALLAFRPWGAMF
jgi:hypothetical protein